MQQLVDNLHFFYEVSDMPIPKPLFFHIFLNSDILS